MRSLAQPSHKEGTFPSLASSFENFGQFAAQFYSILTYQDVGADFHRNRAFCILSQSQAGHLQVSRFFLYAAGIGDDDSGPLLQSKELDIGQRVRAGGVLSRRAQTRRYAGVFADVPEIRPQAAR